jgi:hypothetical protein
MRLQLQIVAVALPAAVQAKLKQMNTIYRHAASPAIVKSLTQHVLICCLRYERDIPADKRR